MYSVTVANHLTLCSNNISTHNDKIIDNEFLSASIILLYMYQPKNAYLIRAFPNALLSGAAPRNSNYTKNIFFNKVFNYLRLSILFW